MEGKKMKTAKILIVLFVTLVSFSVYAEDSQVFKKMSGESFSVFKDSLEKQGLLQKKDGVEFIDTKVLAKAACAFGEENLAALYQKYGTPEKCQGVFIARNGLGATISLDEFQAKGQSVKFWLADISASPGSAVVAVAPKAAASEPKAVVAMSQDDGFIAGIASLKKRIDSIYKEVGQLMTKKEVEAILSVQEKEAAARNNAVIARIDEQSKKIEALEAQAKTTSNTVNTLTGEVSGINTRVIDVEKTVNNSILLKWENVVLGILGTIVLTLCLMAIAVYRKAKAPALQRSAVPHVVASNDSKLSRAA